MSARRSALVLAFACAAAAAGCAQKNLGGLEAVTIERPEVVVFQDEGGQAAAFVWGHGPVDLLVGFSAHCPPHPLGVIGKKKNFGAAYGGAWPRAPAAGDSVVLVLLPGPLMDSLGVTAAGASLVFDTPDSAHVYAWAYVPQGPCGPDTLKTWARLVALPF